MLKLSDGYGTKACVLLSAPDTFLQAEAVAQYTGPFLACFSEKHS